jgi:Rieske 2Fe-2S family protein
MNSQAAAPIKGLEPTLPSSWYYDEAIYRRERERIFYREWFCAGREEELPASGDHRVIDIAGESIIVVRNRDNVLRAFYNVCRHRGARLCRTDDAPTPGMAVRGGVIAGRSIICPYHQWSYDLDGHLIAAPHMSGVSQFDKSSIN